MVRGWNVAWAKRITSRCWLPVKTNNEGGSSGSNNNNTDNGGSLGGGGPMLVPRAPVSLSDLFLDIVSKILIVSYLCLLYV